MVKTFEDAFMILTGHSYADAGFPYEKHRMPHEIARVKLEVICSVLNEGWRPDFLNQAEYKWYPWFGIEARGGSANHTTHAGLSYSYPYNSIAVTNASLGARLCLKTEAIARYAGEQFVDLYELMLLG